MTDEHRSGRAGKRPEPTREAPHPPYAGADENGNVPDDYTPTPPGAGVQ